MAAASKTTAALIGLADVYCAHESRSLEALSGMVHGKGGFFTALKRGGDCRTATAERTLAWFDGHWPQDLNWPATVARPSAKGAFAEAQAGTVNHLPGPSAQFLAGLSQATIWANGWRPPWWDDIEVRDFLTAAHRQMSILRAAKKGAAKFGDRCPKKSAIHLYWQRLDMLLATRPASEAA